MSPSHHKITGPLSTVDLKKLRTMIFLKDFPRDPEWADFEALIAALKKDNMRAAHFLLGKGCRVTKPDSDVHPLHLAVCKLGWYNIAEKLLAVGARVTDLDEKGETALHVAFFNYASDSVLDLLLERYLQETTENLCNKDGISFLHIACTRSNVEIIRDFVVRGQADVNCQVTMTSRSIFAGCTPLHFAAEYSQPDMISFLLEHNADLYARDRNGSTPLHFALERRDVKIIDLILSYDRRHENVVNDFGLSHFMAACVGTREEIVYAFLRVVESQSRTSVLNLINEACKDLNYYKYAGYTSLLFAAEFGRSQTLQLLKVVVERQTRDSSIQKLKEEESGQFRYEMRVEKRSRSLGFICNFIALILFFAMSVPTWLLL